MNFQKNSEFLSTQYFMNLSFVNFVYNFRVHHLLDYFLEIVIIIFDKHHEIKYFLLHE
jgi:hypothetical protein